MKSFFFKSLLLITVSVMSSTYSFAQYEWTKYSGNPLNIHGSPGSWDESVVSPCVIFNPDSNRYEMWYSAWNDGSIPNGGIGFAWSTDGINWTKYSGNPVLAPGTTGWDSLFIGADCVRKEGSTYKMWTTGWKSPTRYPHSVGYATSTDGINWTKHPTPVLTPGTGWESGAVGYPSIIKVENGYWMFYTGEVSIGVALTGRAFSTDGITWQKDLDNNPVLPAGGPGEWDRNNYLPRVIELNNLLYIYYTAETNPGVSGPAIGFATSNDTGKTWTKDYLLNPIITQGTLGSWDNGWVETGEIIIEQNELRLYYDGGGDATNWMGRVGLATSLIVSVEQETIQPTAFLLEQNYPNPFNSATAIQYSIPQRSNVTLKVYDVLGSEIATLINEEKEQGVYTINFDANNLASGLYLYRIQAGSFVDTKKMILLK